MNPSVAAIVVTYNRKELLIKCLESIRSQTHKPDVIYIIDNLSNDGTPERLLEENYIKQLPENHITENQLIHHEVSSLHFASNYITVRYIRKIKNDGGAGGFYEGMKQAYEAGFDWLWLMDDDGIPAKEQLFELLNAPEKYKYRNALVLNYKDTSKLSFGLKNYKNVSDIIEKAYIENEANPFNGTLIHRQIPNEIGFIKREMFIWGDESEYLHRSRKHEFKSATIINAIHYHPENRGVQHRIIPFVKKYKLNIKPKSLAHIYYRNLAYINMKYNKQKLLYYLGVYVLYFSLRLNFLEVLRFLKFYFKGIKGNFK